MQDEREVRDIDVPEPEQRATSDGSQTGDIYEQMCVALYTYRYGAIQFFELIAKFEESLGLPSPQTRDNLELKQPE
jgi:hypothetical protein